MAVARGRPVKLGVAFNASNSALGAALTQAGVPEDQIVQQLTVPKVDKCLMDVPGSAEDQGKARSLLARAKPAVAA